MNVKLFFKGYNMVKLLTDLLVFVFLKTDAVLSPLHKKRMATFNSPFTIRDCLLQQTDRI